MYKHIKLQATVTGLSGDSEVSVFVVEQTHHHSQFARQDNYIGWYKHQFADGFRLWLGSPNRGGLAVNRYDYSSHAYIMLEGHATGYNRAFLCSFAMWEKIKAAVTSYNSHYSK